MFKILCQIELQIRVRIIKSTCKIVISRHDMPRIAAKATWHSEQGHQLAMAMAHDVLAMATDVLAMAHECWHWQWLHEDHYGFP